MFSYGFHAFVPDRGSWIFLHYWWGPDEDTLKEFRELLMEKLPKIPCWGTIYYDEAPLLDDRIKEVEGKPCTGITLQIPGIYTNESARRSFRYFGETFVPIQEEMEQRIQSRT